MNLKYLALLPLFSVYVGSAQLSITPGGQFVVAGNAQLTLQNSDLINNGSFAPGAGVTSFTGNGASSIAGSQAVQFFALEVDKTNNSRLALQRAVGVTQRVLFTAGNLDLNGFDLDLGSTGGLAGERETSRITGANGGEVLSNAVLNAPVAANPGQLGAIISSTKNLGNVVIKRGHQSQQGLGLDSSILRFYDITPASDANLDATLRFTYFNAELNGFDKSSLALFKTDDGLNWSSQGFTARDTTAGFVDKSAIGSLSRWTLSGAVAPLPVEFVFFHADCTGSGVLLSWATALEENSSRFDIERSADGISWTVIGSLPAAGNSAAPRDYSFADGHPPQNGYYRLAQYDLNGRVQYSVTDRSLCSVANTGALIVSPNPFHDDLYATIVVAAQSHGRIRVFDSKGDLEATQRFSLVQGSNRVTVDTRALAAGVYLLAMDSEDGRIQQTVQIVKQ